MIFGGLLKSRPGLWGTTYTAQTAASGLTRPALWCKMSEIHPVGFLNIRGFLKQRAASEKQEITVTKRACWWEAQICPMKTTLTLPIKMSWKVPTVWLEDGGSAGYFHTVSLERLCICCVRVDVDLQKRPALRALVMVSLPCRIHWTAVTNPPWPVKPREKYQTSSRKCYKCNDITAALVPPDGKMSLCCLQARYWVWTRFVVHITASRVCLQTTETFDYFTEVLNVTCGLITFTQKCQLTSD